MSTRRWSSRLSFILTTAAFAVGLGNVWRFPYIVGEGGGGAFLLVYIVLIVLIGIPILTIEIGLGRMAGTTTLVGFGKLGRRPAWNGIGWLGVIANLLIMSFYVMILAWIAIYVGDSLMGKLVARTPESLSAHFDELASDLPRVLMVIVLIIVTGCLIIRSDLRTGLERYAKFMMLALIVMMIGLAIWAATLEHALDGYLWYLTPDFSKITVPVVLSALGQVFFSVGVGMAIAFAFGSYTAPTEDLIRSTTWIVIADTVFAVLAGLMIFPALFSYGLPPESGPNLIFIAMAAVFSQLAYGSWIGGLFFALLFIAGFTSLIASFQGLKDSFADCFSMTPGKSLALVAGIVIAGAVLVVNSYATSPLQPFGMTFFAFFDTLTNTWLLPLGGLFIVLFAGYVLDFETLKKHLESGSKPLKHPRFWKIMIRWLIPVAMAGLVLNGILNELR